MTWKRTITQLGMALALIGSLWFCAGEVGIGESFTAVIDPDGVTSETNTTYGGDVGFIDRVVTAGMWITVLGPMGLAAVTVNKNNPPVINNILKGAPLVLGLIGITEFGSQVGDMISGDFDFDAEGDAISSKIMAATGWVLAALAGLFLTNNNRR